MLTNYLDLFNLSGVFTPSASFTNISGAVGTTGEKIPSFRVVNTPGNSSKPRL
jgi:hypothetical protein